MALLELLFAPLFIPFTLFAALGFWWFMLVLGLFGASQWMVYRDNRRGYRETFDGEYVGPVIVIFVLFFLVNGLTVGETTGKWDWFLTVSGNALVSLLHYLLYGLVAVIPLWMLHMRVNYERLHDALMDFTKSVCNDQNFVPDLQKHDRRLTNLDLEALQAAARAYQRGEVVPEVLMPVWRACRSRGIMEALSPKKNKWLLTSYVVLWPFHVIDKVFGEVLYRIMRWFAARLADLATYFGRFMKFGMASNIDE